MSINLATCLASICLFGISSALFLRDLFNRRSRRLRGLPPGPPGLPIIGNLWNIPTKLEWLTYTRWAQEYGKLAYVESLGQPMVIVSSLDAAMELFERRSSKHSDRPNMVMLNAMLGMEWAFSFMPYGERWRQHRKLFHLAYHPKAVERFYPAQQDVILRLVQRLLISPERYSDHLNFCGAYLMLDITYGYRPKDNNDYYVWLSEKSVDYANSNAHQMFLVEWFPILKNIPSWFPGAHFKRIGLRAQKLNKEVVNEPFEYAKGELAQGNLDTTNFVQELLSYLEEEQLQDSAKAEYRKELIKNTAAIANFGADHFAYYLQDEETDLLIVAGGETSASSSTSFFLAMLLYPEAQKKAQAELDSLLEGKRLPTFEDKEHLPYIQAMVLETLRWRPAAPLGLPHRSIVEDVYEGYRIPKGTLLVGNIWAMLHDEKVYGTDHADFVPERFLSKEGKASAPDHTFAVFGFGRRTCPGRYLALNHLWLTIATVLATYNLRKPLDANGEEITPSLEQTSGVVVRPVPFGCRFEPRSEAAIRLIQGD